MTETLDALLQPSEKVLLRAGRELRTTVWIGLSIVTTVLAGLWLISDDPANWPPWAFGIAAALAALVALHFPKAQLIVTDHRFLMRSGILLVEELVVPLTDIVCFEKGYQRIDIVRRDGERIPVDQLPSLAKATAIIVELTGVDAPVFLPLRLKPWSVLSLGLWMTGLLVGPFLLIFAIAALDGGNCFDPCSDTRGFVSTGVTLALFLPFMLLGSLFGLAIAVAFLRPILSVTDTRMVFEAALSPPMSDGRVDRLLVSMAYSPARLARRFASMLYREEV